MLRNRSRDREGAVAARVFGDCGKATRLQRSLTVAALPDTVRQAAGYHGHCEAFLGGARQHRGFILWWTQAGLWNGTSYIANCLYSFSNLPDGLVRTSVGEFSRFVSAVLCGGEFEGHRILQPATPGETFREQFPKALRPPSWPEVQGLAWYAVRAPDSTWIWLHTGADPGVRTVVMCYPPRRSAVLLFANTAPADGLSDLAGACLREAIRSSATRR